MSYISTIIVGAGPAGLAAALELKRAGTAFVMIDKGKLENRDSNRPHDLANGFGGASLFSDGKVSWAPAGQGVWSLRDDVAIQGGLDTWISLLKQVGAEPEPKPVQAEHGVGGGWTFKPYESQYITPEQRQKLLDVCLEKIRDDVRPNRVVVKIEKQLDLYRVITQQNGDYVTTEEFICKHIVLAGGRFMCKYIDTPFERVFRRVEWGVRIYTGATEAIWSNLEGVDPKYKRVIQEPEGEVRTFCCCRGGEIVKSRFNGLVTWSGRVPDSGPTGLSNIGFMFRSTSSQSRLPDVQEPFEAVPLHKLVEKGYPLFFQNSVINFVKEFGGEQVDLNDFRLAGPCVEGVGEYFRVDDDLNLYNESVFVCGDSSGLFRGLTAAWVSGHYAARQLLGQHTPGTIKNRIFSDVNYLRTMPPIVHARYEIHIFLEPVNPSPEDVERFNLVVDNWNSRKCGGRPKMKACHLGLEFREQGEVRVMQSSRYFVSDDRQKVVDETHDDSLYFAAHGFDVIREKIEVMAQGCLGVPDLSKEFSSKYFEFHVKIRSKTFDIDRLRELSQKFTKELCAPVPVSYNRGKGGQLFLNVRFSHCSLDHAMARVKFIQLVLGDEHLSTMNELVVYDSFRGLDKGWIDF